LFASELATANEVSNLFASNFLIRVELCKESFLGRPLLRGRALLSLDATDGVDLIVPSFGLFLVPSGLPLPLEMIIGFSTS